MGAQALDVERNSLAHQLFHFLRTLTSRDTARKIGRIGREGPARSLDDHEIVHVSRSPFSPAWERMLPSVPGFTSALSLPATVTLRSTTQDTGLEDAIRFLRDTTVHSKGKIAVVSAGTSDIPVAEEAQITAEAMGNTVEVIYDVGVAGIHRLMHNRARLAEARVVVVCAGMEGALPSVVGGMVSVPVIAVPTSVGYGASFRGIAALLGMLNSCASNVAVVNIDNGFGAGYLASVINRL